MQGYTNAPEDPTQHDYPSDARDPGVDEVAHHLFGFGTQLDGGAAEFTSVSSNQPALSPQVVFPGRVSAMKCTVDLEHQCRSVGQIPFGVGVPSPTRAVGATPLTHRGL